MLKSQVALRSLGTALILSIALGVVSTAQSAPDKGMEDTVVRPQDRAFIASKMYAAIGTYFAHFQTIPDFDLDASYQKFLGNAFQAPDRYAFDLACLEFIAQLRNGHSGFSDPWLRAKYGQFFGFNAQYIEKQWVVTLSRLPELKVGDVLEALDGKPIETFYQENKRYISTSNEWANRTQFFNQRYLFPQQFTLTVQGGRKVAIARKDLALTENKTEGKWLTANQVAYIHIPGFDAPQYEQEALKLVEQYKSAAALIVDLRGNGGGSTPGALIDALMDRPYRAQGQASPIHLAVWKVRAGFLAQLDKDPKVPHDETYGYLEAARDLTDNAMLFQPATPQKPEKPLFKGKVIVLIDRHVASAAEDFCIPFKDNHRAIFIGETSYGSTGQPYLFAFENKMSFRVSAKRDCFPDGSTFEGVGILPDTEVPTTIADLRSGKDRVLERALELAR